MLKNKDNNECRDASLDKNYKIWNILSFYSMDIAPAAAVGMIGPFLMFFYTTVAGMPVILFTIANAIFIVWDAINDPIVGAISDKTYKFTKKWGKRFPWIISGIIPTLITFVLFWTPPFLQNPDDKVTMWLQFGFLVVIFILHEFSYTLTGASKLALFSEKFVSAKDRSRAGAISGVSFLLGFFLGTFMPGMILSDNESNPTIYITIALILCVPGIIFAILGIPGCREDEEMIDRALHCAEKTPPLSFFQSMKVVFKNKHMLAILGTATADSAALGILVPALSFWCLYTLGLGTEFVGIFTLINFLMAIIASPFWAWMVRKLGNKKARFIGDLGMAVGYLCFFVPRADFGPVVLGCVASAVLGFNYGFFFVTNTPILGDVIDSITLETKSRQAGVYSGLFILINRIGIVVAPLIMGGVLMLSGFVSGDEATYTSPQAQEAYRALVSWVPAVLITIFNLLFYKMYKLDKEEVEDIKLAIHELGI